MKLLPRKGIRLGLVAGLVATGLVGVTSLTASGQPGPTQELVGELRLTVPSGNVRTGTVEFFAADNGFIDGTPDAIQSLSAESACTTITNAGASLLEITGFTTGSIPVLPGDGLGLLTGNQNCGTSGVIDRNETMRLSLDAYFDAEFGVGVVSVSETKLAVVNPDGQGGNLRIGIDGEDLQRVGPDLGPGLTPITVAGFEFTLDISSTSPRFNKGLLLRDATFTLVKDIPNQAPVADFDFAFDAENYLKVNFTDTSTDDGTIVTRSWNFGDGSASLVNPTGPVTKTYAGPGNYTVTLTVTDDLNATDTETQTVEVFETAVFCGGQVTQPGDPDNGDIATSATYDRLDNKDGQVCEDVGVTVVIEGPSAEYPNGSVFWNNAFEGIVTGNTQQVQAYFTIVWSPTADLTKLDRKIDYDADPSNGSGDEMLWCAGYDSQGIPILPAYGEQGAIDVDPDPEVEDLRAPWCLVEDVRELQADGKIGQTQKLFGSGDPRGWA